MMSDISKIFHIDDTFTFWMHISEIIRVKMMIFDYGCFDENNELKYSLLGYNCKRNTFEKSGRSQVMLYASNVSSGPYLDYY